MKSSLSRDIGGDVFMALETESTLARFRERLVTAFAFLLKFGVRLGHLTWQYQLLEQALRLRTDDRC